MSNGLLTRIEIEDAACCYDNAGPFCPIHEVYHGVEASKILDCVQRAKIDAAAVSEARCAKQRQSTMTIHDIAMVRRVLLETIDDGYYMIYHADEALANGQRLCLCDDLQRKLTEAIK